MTYDADTLPKRLPPAPKKNKTFQRRAVMAIAGVALACGAVLAVQSHMNVPASIVEMNDDAGTVTRNLRQVDDYLEQLEAFLNAPEVAMEAQGPQGRLQRSTMPKARMEARDRQGRLQRSTMPKARMEAQGRQGRLQRSTMPKARMEARDRQGRLQRSTMPKARMEARDRQAHHPMQGN